MWEGGLGDKEKWTNWDAFPLRITRILNDLVAIQTQSSQSGDTNKREGLADCEAARRNQNIRQHTQEEQSC